jgi:hypothetical protein
MAKPCNGAAVQLSPVVAVIINASNESSRGQDAFDVRVDEVDRNTVTTFPPRCLDERYVAGQDSERLG